MWGFLFVVRVLMQGGKLGLHICGVHLLSPCRAVVGRLNLKRLWFFVFVWHQDALTVSVDKVPERGRSYAQLSNITSLNGIADGL